MAFVYGTAAGETLDDADGVTDDWDHVYGYEGDDTLYGRGGNDRLIGGAGADALYGGGGRDHAAYYDSDAGVIVNLATGLGAGGYAEGDTLYSIEGLIGSSYDDTLIGNEGGNVLHGGAGHDTLKGGGGSDTLDGGAGDDTLRGDGGADVLNGNTGIDTVSYEDSPSGVTVLLLADEAAFGDAEGDELLLIENLTGSAHADTLWGDDNVNVLRGLGGNDTLKGFGGTDTLDGGAGADILEGMDGTDTLYGRNGQDRLNGGAGGDFLYGGNGADTFVWPDTSETWVDDTDPDIVRDFNRAEGDVIDLSAIDANVYAGGNQAFAFIGTDAFSGTPGEIRYYHSGGNTFIEMQTGNSVDVEGMIRLDGIHDPQASWFLL